MVRSWLLDLTADALKKNPTLDGLEPYVADSGEGRWTVAEAIDLNVSAPIITESLIRRIRSREENNFTDRMLAIMRNAVRRPRGQKRLSTVKKINSGGPLKPICLSGRTTTENGTLKRGAKHGGCRHHRFP